jgi:hypothetical protein
VSGANGEQTATGAPSPASRNSKSMHDGIAVWCDCCTCEAEPYWMAAAEEMGLELGSDYEDGRRY